MGENNKASHVSYDIKYHIIWTTKYRYKVLGGNISKRLQELIRQGCEAGNITILKGNIRKDHVHMLISCPPSLAPSKIVQYLKGRSSRLLQEEFGELKRRYWGQRVFLRNSRRGHRGNDTGVYREPRHYGKRCIQHRRLSFSRCSACFSKWSFQRASAFLPTFSRLAHLCANPSALADGF